MDDVINEQPLILSVRNRTVTQSLSRQQSVRHLTKIIQCLLLLVSVQTVKACGVVKWLKTLNKAARVKVTKGMHKKICEKIWGKFPVRPDPLKNAAPLRIKFRHFEFENIVVENLAFKRTSNFSKGSLDLLNVSFYLYHS